MRTLVAITGASSGIGEAFARKLAPEHDLLLIARRKERLQGLAAEFSSQYRGSFQAMEADLTRQEDLARVAERLERAPELVLLVNNAGFGAGGLFWEAPFSEQEDMHKLHVMAPLQLTHAALRNMTRRDSGAVINVASVAAFIRRPGSVSYSATKSWMTTFSEAIYAELKSVGSKVTVQALCPGFTYSEFHDKLGWDRKRIAPAAFWHSAEFVVEASLNGLRRGKLFVIPGWRYRLLTAFLTAVPTPLRLMIESGMGARKQVGQVAAGDRSQIADGTK